MKLFKNAIEDFLSKEEIGRCDFHTHSFFSDGVLLPIEQLRRAFVIGHEAYAITDHVSASNLDIIPKLTKDCELAIKHWGLLALPGVELTHVPANAIEEVAEKAREMGAFVIVVHGETISEPVEPGTNMSAANLANVDILAHPGLLSKEEAKLCKQNNVFIEITSSRSHSITNGHVAKIGLKENVNFIQNTDTHRPNDMLTYTQGEEVLFGTGFHSDEVTKILQDNVQSLIAKIYEEMF